MKKKAMSDVIANVLIISLAITAVVIIGSFVLPMVKVNLSPAVSCITLNSAPPALIVDSCFNEKTNNIEILVSRKMDSFEIVSFSFIIRNSNKASSFKCSRECAGCKILNPGSENIYFFNFQEFAESTTLTYFINDCEITTIKVDKKC